MTIDATSAKRFGQHLKMCQRTVTTWEDADDGTRYHQCGMAYRIREPADGDGVHFLVYLKKTRKNNGAEVLQAAERFVADQLGGKELRLQDASFISCKNRNMFDLAFRHLLTHCRTWYESQGYQVVGAWAARLRESVGCAIVKYATVPVVRVLDAVRLQTVALSRPDATWTPADISLHNSLETDEHDAVPSSTRLCVLRARRRLQALLETAPKGSELGVWLPGLPCADYAFFMEAMYGGRLDRHPRWAIADVGGVRTPTMELFKRANGLKRYSGRIKWAKRLSARR